MHPAPTDGYGPIGDEIVRSAWQHAESGGNDRTADLSWAAGFFDGEGYIGINSARRTRTLTRSHTLVLSVANTDIRPLAKFHQVIGEGRLYRYPEYQANHRPKAVWHAAGPAAARALEEMLPWLWGKHEQARVGIDFQRGKLDHQRGVALTDEQFERERAAQTLLRELRAKIGRN